MKQIVAVLFILFFAGQVVASVPAARSEAILINRMILVKWERVTRDSGDGGGSHSPRTLYRDAAGRCRKVTVVLPVPGGAGSAAWVGYYDVQGFLVMAVWTESELGDAERNFYGVAFFSHGRMIDVSSIESVRRDPSRPTAVRRSLRPRIQGMSGGEGRFFRLFVTTAVLESSLGWPAGFSRGGRLVPGTIRENAPALVNGSGVRVRRMPHSGQPVVGELEPGMTVQVSGVGAEERIGGERFPWYLVTYRDRKKSDVQVSGWVYGKYLEPAP